MIEIDITRTWALVLLIVVTFWTLAFIWSTWAPWIQRLTVGITAIACAVFLGKASIEDWPDGPAIVVTLCALALFAAGAKALWDGARERLNNFAPRSPLTEQEKATSVNS